MPNSDDKKKYQPLGEYLAALPSTTNDITLSFAQVEKIIDATLPPSATTYREWWANQERGARAPHWSDAGFKVYHADLKRQIVRFKRLAPANERPRALTLQQVVTVVNERAQGRPFGGLPEWRRAHKGKERLPGTPFYADVKADRDWVFHVGGLTELQFNLGFEEVHGVRTFRHGVAFSLQTTRVLPTIDPLVPKIARFNEYLRIYPDAFAGFAMWNCSPDGSRGDNYPVAPIPNAHVKPEFFIFIGALQPANAIDVGLILDDFDRLIPLYRFVEGTSAFPTRAPERKRRGFVWSPGNKARMTMAAFERSAQTVEKSLRHNAIQAALYEHLDSVHGGGVSGEQDTANGTYIDVAVCDGDEYVYYEIKTGLSAQSCIREALGQLLPGGHPKSPIRGHLKFPHP